MGMAPPEWGSNFVFLFFSFSSFDKTKPGRWHNGTALVFCQGDCPFESEPTPTSADAFEEVTGWLAAKRSACVAPEVDLRECALHSPLQKSE